MKAVQITAPNVLEIVELPRPKPAADQVLLQIKASGLCHTDLNILEGKFHAHYPIIPGHEFAGKVVAVGEDADPGWMSKYAVVDPNVPCGRCSACRTNRQNQCENLDAYGVTIPGGFAEYAAVKEANLYPLGNLSLEQAVFAEPLGCVLHGLNQIPSYQGGRALVFGAGPMGLLMMQSLKFKGIVSVSVVDLHRERLARAEKLGASKTYQAAEQEKLKERFDVVVDATGVAGVIARLPGYTATSGSILYFGVAAPGDKVEIEPYDIYRRDIRIAGSFSLKAGIAPALKLLQSGLVEAEELLTHKIKLEQFGEAIKLVGRASVLKVVVQD
ncbi:MAG: zinc-dependent alcohol dehydrogenase family protein [Firmicutes bacterium]|nr:zinc-dependent alcohol dehydrogenase family protein [Bacillota bacterium]